MARHHGEVGILAALAPGRILAPLVRCLMVMIFVSSTTLASATSGAPGDPRALKSFGYLPEWRYRFLDEDHADRLAAMCEGLTHLIFFSLEMDAQGRLIALDRLPNSERLARTRRVCPDVKLLVCFGGNGRSGGFSAVVQSEALRASFLSNLDDLLATHGLDGVDWNWEYPASKEDWFGLKALLEESRGRLPIQTMAYYPDGRQEHLIKHLGMHESVDFLHAMAYDQPRQHSTFTFAATVEANVQRAELPPAKVTLGLPFYARNIANGEWRTYHDVLADIEANADDPSIVGDQFQGWYFNGPQTIAKKIREIVIAKGLGGVMIWESGQDSVGADLHKAIRDTLWRDAGSPAARDEL